MALPFSQAQFFDVMADYNRAVWPAPVLLTAAAVVAAGLVVRRRPGAGRWVGAVLAVLWAWTAVVYHAGFFSAINPAAWLFAAVSLAGALAFAWYGVWQGRLRIAPGAGLPTRLGWALMAFALAVYPAIGHLVGHRFPMAPTFGLPCPTTIFTLGVLLCTTADLPRRVYAAPLLWSAIGASAAFLLGVYEDLGLAVAGGLALAQLLRRTRAASQAPLATGG